MLNRDEALLIFVDVQGRLHEVMAGKASLDANLARMIKCAKLLELPILGTEQIPEKLGATNEPFKSMLEGFPVISKATFSCCGNPEFYAAFKAEEKRQVILIGIETHVCVYQTAIDLLEHDIEVFVVADAVSSRSLENKELALQAMRDAGAQIIPSETVLFALLRDAADPHFKELLGLIK